MAQVLKFGGSTFAQLSDFGRIARYLASRMPRPADRLAVVVSAMPGDTEYLRGRANSVVDRPSAQAFDGLLPLADTVSANYLRMALEEQHVSATVLVGHTLGLVTDSVFSRAQLVRTHPEPLLLALTDHQVVLVPGGQAMDQQGQQTSMGKNSSDLSAVVVAVALGAGRCEIFSDVDGIYSGDPRVLSGTRLLPELSWEVAHRIVERGAKVLHGGAVVMAGDRGIEMLCRKNRGNYGTGTRITADGNGCAVVLDMRAAVATFERAAGADEAHASLVGNGVPALRLGGLRPVVAVPGGFFDLSAYLWRRRLGGTPHDRCLLSVVRPEGETTRLVHRSTAVVEAQSAHDRFAQEAASGTGWRPDLPVRGGHQRVDGLRRQAPDREHEEPFRGDPWPGRPARR